MDHETIVTDLLRQYVPHNHKTNKRGISFNCPMCTTMGEARNDTRMRGGLKYEGVGGFLYHCFNCSYATRYEPGQKMSKNCMKFLTTLGVPRSSIPIQLLLMAKPPAERIKPPTPVLDYAEVKLPYGSKTITELAETDEMDPDYINVIQYLFDRGEHLLDSQDYYWTPGDKWAMNKRFIIPFVHNGSTIGWVARYASDNVPEPHSRYYGSTPPNFLFNGDLLKSYNQDVIILVEGVLDAIVIGGVAVLGNRLTDDQIRQLKISGKRIIVLPDRNKAGKTLVTQAIENDFEVSIPEWNMNLPGSEDTTAAVKKFGLIYTMETIYKEASKDKNKILTRFGVVSLS